MRRATRIAYPVCGDTHEMYDNYAHLPHDIAMDKRAADRVKRTHEGAAFGGLRKFNALRIDAPGIIAKFVLSAMLSIAMLLYFFQDLNVVGFLPIAGFCIKVVLIIALCFWVTSIIWRVVGVSVRNFLRYVVRNMWSLAATGMLAAGAVFYVFVPETREVPLAQAAAPKRQPESIVVEAPILIERPRHELPQNRRVFAGDGWQILHNDDFSYSTAPAKEAPEQCQAIGEDWILADRPDFEGLEVELKKGGHVGSFWTASARPKTSLEYALNGDGDSRYQWALSGNDAERIVLCVVAFQID